jgi:hypothetical protein
MFFFIRIAFILPSWYIGRILSPYTTVNMTVKDKVNRGFTRTVNKMMANK